jgi:hypothetical protein
LVIKPIYSKGGRDRVEVTEGTEEEVLELEENPTTALVTALTDAINIGDLGTINESNIDLALETLRTQLEVNGMFLLLICRFTTRILLMEYRRA